MNVTVQTEKNKDFLSVLPVLEFANSLPGNDRSAAGATGGVGQRLGRLTIFADQKTEAIDAETLEVTAFEWISKGAGERVPCAVYDQDASDLERWILKASARRVLMKIETRKKRVRVNYSEFVWYCDIQTRSVRSVLTRERYYVEDSFSPVPVAAAELAGPRNPKGGLNETLLSVPLSGGVVSDLVNKPRFRVVNCCRDKIGANVAPEVWYSKKSDRCSYHKVGVCGSVWTCPICSRRINMKRQAQIAAAYNLFVTSKAELAPGVRDGDAVMVTMTIKHGAGDDLADLLGKLKRADRVFLQTSFAYKKLVGYTKTERGQKYHYPSSLAYVGRVTATEITHGKNGWHPHVHQLWFFDRRLKESEIVRLRRELFEEWRKACVAVGLPEPVEYVNRRPVGVDARRALSAEEYMTKFGDARQWSVEKELVGQHVKTAKKGRSAFQLLWDYAQGDNKAGKLFSVFADATLGKHQLEFSKTLRARLLELGLDEILKSDEALAAENEADAEKIGTLTDDDFQALLDAEKFTPGLEVFGTLLHLAKRQGFDVAVSWLRSLPSYQSAVSRSRCQDDEAAFERAAERSQNEFWSYINLVGGVPPLEEAADLLGFELDAAKWAKGWKSLELEARKSWLVWCEVARRG